MFDWPWRVLKTVFFFILLLGVMIVFAWYTRTLLHALGGALFALTLQFALYMYATRGNVNAGINIELPLHRMIRWDNTLVRTVKPVVEMLGIACMGALAWLFMASSIPKAASFLAFGVLFISAPVPLILWIYYRNVLQPGHVAMQQPGHRHDVFEPHVMQQPRTYTPVVPTHVLPVRPRGPSLPRQPSPSMRPALPPASGATPVVIARPRVAAPARRATPAPRPFPSRRPGDDDVL